MTGSRKPSQIDRGSSRRYMIVKQVDDAAKPMTLAEAAECCGQLHFRAEVDDAGVVYCENCPLLIERKREDILRQARAL